MNYTPRSDKTGWHKLNANELGQRFNDMSQATRAFVDDVIRYGNQKIATIKFLRSQLDLSLVEAKQLYEARQTWLGQVADPYNFIR